MKPKLANIAVLPSKSVGTSFHTAFFFCQNNSIIFFFFLISHSGGSLGHSLAGRVSRHRPIPILEEMNSYT